MALRIGDSNLGFALLDVGKDRRVSKVLADAVGAINARAKEIGAGDRARERRREPGEVRSGPPRDTRPPRGGVGTRPPHEHRPKPVHPDPPDVRAPAVDGGVIVADGGEVIVDIQHSDSGYDNQIYWSADGWETWNPLGLDDRIDSINLGTFKPGTRIAFGIDNGQGDRFTTDAVGADGVQHARIDATSDGMRVGFEDLFGGGDMDFNDAVISVHTRVAHADPPFPPDDPPVPELPPPELLEPEEPPEEAPEPGPVEDAPVDPWPVELGPVDPEPVDPAPVELGPVDPGEEWPVEDRPVEPDRSWSPPGHAGRGRSDHHLGEYLDDLLPEPAKRPHWVEPPAEGQEPHIDIER